MNFHERDMLRRLASACARGWRQQGLVNELLSGTVKIEMVSMGPRIGIIPLYGASKVTHPSFGNLRTRLHAAGFVITIQRNIRTVSISFPEMNLDKLIRKD